MVTGGSRGMFFSGITAGKMLRLLYIIPHLCCCKQPWLMKHAGFLWVSSHTHESRRGTVSVGYREELGRGGSVGVERGQGRVMGRM